VTVGGERSVVLQKCGVRVRLLSLRRRTRDRLKDTFLNLICFDHVVAIVQYGKSVAPGAGGTRFADYRVWKLWLESHLLDAGRDWR